MEKRADAKAITWEAKPTGLGNSRDLRRWRRRKNGRIKNNPHSLKHGQLSKHLVSLTKVMNGEFIVRWKGKVDMHLKHLRDIRWNF